MASKVNVDRLTGAAETLLPMLYAKVQESQRPDGIFRDPKVLEIYERLNYDFSRFQHDWITQTGVAIRAEIFDEEVREFLERHPGATVVNLGAGLDTRFFRVDNGQVTWYELDLPQSIDARRELLPETERHRMLAYSATDAAWLDRIGCPLQLLIVCEGMSMYLEEAQVRQLFVRLADRFAGCQLVMDAVTPWIVNKSRRRRTRSFRGLSAELSWGVYSGSQLEGWDKRIHLLREQSAYDRHASRWRWIWYLSRIKKLGYRFKSHVMLFQLGEA